ncbi:hypothetical protein Mgra_00004882 [Meloidogyne graminicola]|uniref:Beta-1,4-N-acetylgalactosaminyltransferase n=1 Tax=Meloidogyne graminicola TaxID=189291 RepID=A0A8S9ZR56_9BILA|nr:hypothetical protein Mgra_00004882 [Meloidogyne graminicola]
MKSSNVLHKYRIAYHSLNNSSNHFENICLHCQLLERKWRSLLFISIISIILIFFYLTFFSFDYNLFYISSVSSVNVIEEISTQKPKKSEERLQTERLSLEEDDRASNSSEILVNSSDAAAVVLRNTSNISNNSSLPFLNSSNSDLPLCPSPPPNLVGPIPVWMDGPTFDKLEELYSNIGIGGHGKPNECLSRHKVAIIVPYRDREHHLRIFLHNIHSFLRKQQIDYGIFVIEQIMGQTFNRGKLINVGFVEANRYYDWNCIIFHDVDLLPEDDRNLYTCPQQPRHMSVAVDKFSYRLPYYTIFGGAGALTKNQMTKVNGFSNDYWGWGGEDDDFSARISYAGYTISRYPSTIARYKMIKHVKEALNPINLCRHILMKKTKSRWKTDGLINLNYRIVSTTFSSLYTNITVNLLEEEARKNLTLEHLGEGC